jgi:hypothetical protein
VRGDGPARPRSHLPAAGVARAPVSAPGSGRVDVWERNAQLSGQLEAAGGRACVGRALLLLQQRARGRASWEARVASPRWRSSASWARNGSALMPAAQCGPAAGHLLIACRLARARCRPRACTERLPSTPASARRDPARNKRPAQPTDRDPRPPPSDHLPPHQAPSIAQAITMCRAWLPPLLPPLLLLLLLGAARGAEEAAAGAGAANATQPPEAAAAEVRSLPDELLPNWSDFQRLADYVSDMERLLDHWWQEVARGARARGVCMRALACMRLHVCASSARPPTLLALDALSTERRPAASCTTPRCSRPPACCTGPRKATPVSAAAAARAAARAGPGRLHAAQPAARSPQPAARSPQPAARSPQPAARSPQPAARSPQPAAGAAEQAAATHPTPLPRRFRPQGAAGSTTRCRSGWRTRRRAWRAGRARGCARCCRACRAGAPSRARVGRCQAVRTPLASCARTRPAAPTQGTPATAHACPRSTRAPPPPPGPRRRAPGSLGAGPRAARVRGDVQDAGGRAALAHPGQPARRAGGPRARGAAGRRRAARGGALRAAGARRLAAAGWLALASWCWVLGAGCWVAGDCLPGREAGRQQH